MAELGKGGWQDAPKTKLEVHLRPALPRGVNGNNKNSESRLPLAGEENRIEEAKSGGWVVGTELSTFNILHSAWTLVCALMSLTITSSYEMLLVMARI